MPQFVNDAVALCNGAADIGAFTWETIRNTGYALRRHKLLFKQLYEVGNKSLPIVTVFGLFVGLILVLYSGNTLAKFGQAKYVGLTGLAIVWEFGPVFTAFIIAARIGSAYAAEIGTMKVYDEIDSLVSMGVKPEAYLATPRLLACAILLPALVIYADFAAMIGGAGMAWFYVHVSPRLFFQQFFQNLVFHEVTRSLIKAFIFGGVIAVVGCYRGLRTTGGAEGVGRSTTQSVVQSLLAILVADYFISKLLLAIPE